MSLYYVAFDDTDTIDTIGTGHILAGFLATLPFNCSYISRHQLYVHESVPYTSHNSSMCATVEGQVTLERLVQDAAEYLAARFVPGSDPGLCVADYVCLQHAEALISWGQRAKSECLTKEEAYARARQCGVHLSEHGGTGQGVVGALAAVGLRLSGNDGRIRGKKQVEPAPTTVEALLKQTGFDQVITRDGTRISAQVALNVGNGDVKAVLKDGLASVVVSPSEWGYTLLSKEELKTY